MTTLADLQEKNMDIESISMQELKTGNPWTKIVTSCGQSECKGGSCEICGSKVLVGEKGVSTNSQILPVQTIEDESGENDS
jgi:hypothetical protein